MLENSAREQPHNPDPLNQIGQIFLRQHRRLPAEDAFNRALARQPNNALATAGLAEARLNQGDWPRAMQLWQTAATINPNLPGVFTGLGRTHLLRLEFNRAKAAFLKQQNHRSDPEAQWYLAALEAPTNLEAANDYLLSIPADASVDVLARRDYLLAALVPFTAESPPEEVAHATGIALVQAGLWPLAIHALKNEISPETDARIEAERLAFLGHAQAQAGHPALDLFEQARLLNPSSALPLYFYGIYLRQQNALSAAEQQFIQAIALDPDNAAIYAELALTKAGQGNFIAAEEQFEAAIAAAEDDLTIRMMQLRFYAGRGYRVVEAGIPAAEAIIEADGTNAEAYDWLGWMYVQAGQPEKAEDAYRQAIKIAPNLVSARYHLARLLEANGQSAEAIPLYQQVVDWDSSGVFRNRALKNLQQLREKSGVSRQ